MRTLLSLLVVVILVADVALPLEAHAQGTRRRGEAQGPRRREPPREEAGMDRPSAPLSGRVLLPDGRPAANARVFFRKNENHPLILTETTTDRSGNFRFPARVPRERDAGGGTGRLRPAPRARSRPDMFGKYLAVTALAAGYPPVYRRILGDGTGAAPLELRLEPATTVTGRLLRLDGRPAGDVVLHAASLALDRFAVHRLLPDEMVARLYRARTDARGHFALPGLPRQGRLDLELEGALILAPGSAVPVQLHAAERNDAGLLIAVQPARIKVRVRDRVSGGPAPNVQVVIFSEAVSTVWWPKTDERGEIEGELMPGDHSLLVEGLRRQVTLEEGQTAGPLEIAVRRGTLEGRVFDAQGAPAAGVGVRIDGEVRELGREDVPLRPEGLLGLLVGAMAGGGSRFAKTGPDGRFQVDSFAWGSPSVTVRATRGNEVAAWSGPAEGIGDSLELRLRPGVLTSVRGRLVDAQRQPIPMARFLVLQWGEPPDDTRFVGDGESDGEGRFRVDGLERGRSLSLLAAEPRFASARLLTPGAERSPNDIPQDLGDVVVLPMEILEQSRQIAERHSPEPLARQYGLLPPPSAEMIAQARQALERYRAALKQADIAALRRMTARISANAAGSPLSLLLAGTLRLGLADDERAMETVLPLRVVPRYEAGDLIRLREWRREARAPGVDPGAKAVDMDGRVVFLAAARADEVRIAAILLREDGEWRFVTPPTVPELPFEFRALLETPVIASGPEAREFRRPAPPLGAEQQRAARAAGERYLSAWSRAQEAPLLEETSPLALDYAPGVADFRKRRAQRLDRGVCPFADGARPTLEPLEGLTVWEQGFLVRYALAAPLLTGLHHLARLRYDSPFGPLRDEIKYARQGDLATFRYSVDGRPFLMLLVRHNKRWQVLEPALRL